MHGSAWAGGVKGGAVGGEAVVSVEARGKGGLGSSQWAGAGPGREAVVKSSDSS